MVKHEDTGLRGIRAATSCICQVDGAAGTLSYRGFSIEDLARGSTFEEVTYLLLKKRLPKKGELESFTKRIASHRPLPTEIVDMMERLPLNTPPMAVLQAGVALLSAHDPDPGKLTQEASVRRAVRIIAAMPSLVAVWKRLRNGLSPVEPREDLSHAANFLYMVKGEPPAEEIARFMDVAMILHADHELNASTFAARVVASTMADMYASISAGIGALSGPLHGGANAQVMRNLIDTNDPDKIELWVEEQFNQGKRISGMGHAVYRTIDPRAKILQAMAKTILKDHPEYRWYEMTERMVLATQERFRNAKGRDIYPNVDLYSASIYHAMGIHHDFYPPVFAMARSAGWCAHVIEEKFPQLPVKATIYRPSSTYVGDVGCKYDPVDER